MAVEVCHDAWRQVATMYCNTSDTAFGPIFTGPAAGTEIEDFLAWIYENGQITSHAWKTRIYGDGSDPRDYSPDGLQLIVDRWRDQYEPVVPEPQSLRVSAEDEMRDSGLDPMWHSEPDGYRLDGGRMIPTDR